MFEKEYEYAAGKPDSVYECASFEGARTLARDMADKWNRPVDVWRRDKRRVKHPSELDAWKSVSRVEPTLWVLERCR